MYGAALLPLIDAVNAVVARATPPSSIPEPHPLPWWDKMRYQVHGTWLVTAQEMHLLHLTAPTYERWVVGWVLAWGGVVPGEGGTRTREG